MLYDSPTSIQGPTSPLLHHASKPPPAPGSRQEDPCIPAPNQQCAPPPKLPEHISCHAPMRVLQTSTHSAGCPSGDLDPGFMTERILDPWVLGVRMAATTVQDNTPTSRVVQVCHCCCSNKRLGVRLLALQAPRRCHDGGRGNGFGCKSSSCCGCSSYCGL